MIPALFDRKLWRLRQQRNSPGLLTDLINKQIAERITHFQRSFQTGVVIGPCALKPALHTFTIPKNLTIDEECFPFAAQSIDVIVSNQCLHVVNDLPGTLRQFVYTLKPDGLLLAALIGGETLHELCHAFYEAEMKLYQRFSPRVMPLLTLQDVGMLLQRAGFALPVVDVETHRLPFPDIKSLMHFLRAEGLTNVLYERNKAALSRALLKELERTFEGFATFEIIFITAWAPSATQQKPLKPGSAVHKLEQLLNSRQH